MLLLDGVPASGYRGFLNFFAHYSVHDLTAIDAIMDTAAPPACSSAARPAPVLVSSHQPLGTVQSGPWWRWRHSGPALLVNLLARRGSLAVVSGHLHDAFGPRLHGWHEAGAPAARPAADARDGSAAAAAAAALSGTARCADAPDWQSLARCVLRTLAGGNLTPPALASPSSAARLLEAETADWKLRRRFRIITARAGVLSFTDARFIVASEGSAGDTEDVWPTAPANVAALPPGSFSCSVQHEEPTAIATPFLVHVAVPPDGRHFPQRASQLPWQLEEIDVLLFATLDLCPRGRNPVSDVRSAALTPLAAHARLTCAEPRGAQRALWSETLSLALSPAAAVHYGGASSVSENASMPAHAPPHVRPWRATGKISSVMRQRAQECSVAGNALAFQAFALTERHGTAASELRPVLAAAEPHTAPLPLENTALERFVIGTAWPEALAWAYYSALAAQLAIMLVARVFALDIMAFGCRIAGAWITFRSCSFTTHPQAPRFALSAENDKVVLARPAASHYPSTGRPASFATNIRAPAMFTSAERAPPAQDGSSA